MNEKMRKQSVKFCEAIRYRLTNEQYRRSIIRDDLARPAC